MRTYFPVASHHGGIIQTSDCFLEKLLREETLSPEPKAEFYTHVLWDSGSREFSITLQASFLAPLSPQTEPHLEVIHRLELASQAVKAQQRHSGGANNSPRRALPRGCGGDGKDLPRRLCDCGPWGRGGAGRVPRCPVRCFPGRDGGKGGICRGSALLGLLVQSILQPSFRLRADHTSSYSGLW